MSNWSDNPFAQDDADNPFADPSVKQAATTVPEYNPFDAKPARTAPSSVASPPQSAAVAPPPASEDLPAWAQPKSSPPPSAVTPPPASYAQPQPQPPPPSSSQPAWADPQSSNQNNSNTAQPMPPGVDPVAYQAAKSMREIEYAERERKARMQEKVTAEGRPPNFPNFPMWMRYGFIKPCYHIDIKSEIPILAQTVVRITYYSWIILVIALFWNFVATLSLLAASKTVSGTGTSCALSAAYFVLFSPCSLYCWFMPLYNALRVDSSLKFGWFFLVMGFQFAASIFFSVGFPKTGAAGIWVAAEATDSNKTVAVLAFVSAAIWICHSMLTSFILYRVLIVYRMSGFTASDMQREAISAAASNKTLQRAAVDHATQAFNQ